MDPGTSKEGQKGKKAKTDAEALTQVADIVNARLADLNKARKDPMQASDDDDAMDASPNSPKQQQQQQQQSSSTPEDSG